MTPIEKRRAGPGTEGRGGIDAPAPRRRPRAERSLRRTSLALWGIAGLLVAAWAIVHARGSRAPVGTVPIRASGPVPVLPPDSVSLERIDGIELRSGDAVMAFERRDDGWWQHEPYEQPAEGAPLREILLRAVELHAARSVPADSADLAALGLDPPRAEVILATRDGTAPSRTRLRLGGRGVGGRAWLRIDDGPALSVDPALHDAVLESDLRRLRSWRLFDLVGAGTDRVVIDRTPADPSRPRQRFAVERREGRWRMVEPFRTRVDGDVVEALLGALAKVEHAGFADESPQELALYGLERPIASVELHTRRGAAPVVERLEIGSALAQGGAICARRSGRPPIVLLDQTALAALLPAPAAFVDPRPCGLLPADIRGIRIRSATGKVRVRLERTLDGWRVVDGSAPGGEAGDAAQAAPPTQPPSTASRPARDAAVRELLERLCSARATELALQPMPPELVVATIELEPTVGAAVVVRVAREGDGGAWALDESDDVLRVFPPSFSIPLEPRDFAAPIAR